MLLEQRWSKSEDEESTLPGVDPFALFFPPPSPLSFSKFILLSINHSRRLVRAGGRIRERLVLVQEIADDVEEVEGSKSRRQSSEKTK